MILLVDCGNSRIKWAEADDGQLGAGGFEPHVGRAESAVQAMVDTLSTGPTRAIVSNVAGDELERLLRRRLSVEPEFVATGRAALGVRCGYVEPETLGVDRWLAILAAHRRASGPVCVVSAGTAVTIDIVTGDGEHVGGLILAGARLAGSALNERTRGIGATALPQTRPAGLELFGTTTDAAVGHGVMLGIAAAIERSVAVATTRLGTPPELVLTGGDAQLVHAWLDSEARIEADLVLDGLLLVANESN